MAVKKSQSSALLITLIIMGLLSVLIFGIARLILYQITNAEISEDSMIAYHAAESGIEEGLLIIRNNPNAEIGSGTSGVNGQYTAGPKTVTLDNGSIFELSMNYLESTTPGGLTLAKDQVLQYKIKPGISDNITVSWTARPTSVGTPAWQGCAQLYIYKIYTNAGTDNKDLVPSYTSDSTKFVAVNSGDSNVSLRITSYMNTASSCAATITSGDTSVPNDAMVNNLKISSSDSSKKYIDTGKTTITSIGSYGKAKRKLVAEIDRSSGGLLHIFDYAIYSTGSLGL